MFPLVLFFPLEYEWLWDQIKNEHHYVTRFCCSEPGATATATCLLCNNISISTRLAAVTPQAGRAWTAPSSVPAAHGAWDAIRPACVPTGRPAIRWTVSARVLPGGGENTVTSPAQ